MRLKSFIIFIIIYTIIYFVGLAIFDHFKNKKDYEKNQQKNYNLLDIKYYYNFAYFYGLSTDITNEKILAIYEDFKNNSNIVISEMCNKYYLTKEELIVLVMFLEHYGLIKTRSIKIDQDLITPLSEKDESLILKYSLLFSNKLDYRTILTNAGFGSDKEIEYMKTYYLIPGIKIENETVEYVGDNNE